MRPPFLLFVAASLVAAAPPTYVVSARGGTHATLQSAIHACPSTGCRIELPDSLYEFSEPVSIRGKADISIVGTRTDGTRPILTVSDIGRSLVPVPDIGTRSASSVLPVVWKSDSLSDTVIDTDGRRTIRRFTARYGKAGYAASILLHPGRTPSGAVDPLRPAGWLVSPYPDGQMVAQSTGLPVGYLGHMYPGLLQIDSSRRIAVENIHFAGGLPVEFILDRLWLKEWSVFSGLAAISLNRSLAARILECEFDGWWLGIRAMDDNPGGLVTDLMDLEPMYRDTSLRPLEAPGSAGGHVIEGNLAHGNVIFLNLERSFDLASSIRFNRAWDNGTSRLQPAANLDRSNPANVASDKQWVHGGFAFLKDVMYPVNIFQGNTLVRNTRDLEWNTFRVSTTQVFVDNAVVRQESRDWRELNGVLEVRNRGNWLTGPRLSFMDLEPADSTIPFCSTSRCKPLTPLWGSPSIDAKLVGKGWLGDDIGAVWSEPRQPEALRLQDQTLGHVFRQDGKWRIVLPVPLEAASGVGSASILRASARRIVIPKEPHGSSSTDSGTILSSLLGRSLQRGVNILDFTIPAKADDSIWLVELVASATSSGSGRALHSNIGTWLVRPLGKQLVATLTDSLPVEPGQTVEIAVVAKDSLGNDIALDAKPSISGEGWTPVAGNEPAGVAARKASTSNGFVYRAKAPSVPGISRLVFVGQEDGRVAAIPGAIYLAVGGSITSAAPRSARPLPRVASIRRDGAGWSVEFSGLDAGELADALVVDASGRRWNATQSESGRNPSMHLPRALSGTCFLKSGGTTLPFVLVP